MNDETVFVAVGKAAHLTGLDPQTIRKMADKKLIACYKTPSGQRRISVQSIQTLCHDAIPSKEKSVSKKKNYIYARVSTKKQLDDLSRQIELIRSAKLEYANYTVIKDIGSGINFSRKGLQTILDSCLQGDIGKLVIAHRDRLSRFGYELISYLVRKAGGQIIVLNDSGDSTPTEKFTNDIMSIIHVYSCKQMGSRSYKPTQIQNDKNKAISHDETEINIR